MSRIVIAGLSALIATTSASASITGGGLTGGSAFSSAGGVFVCCGAPAEVGLNRQESPNVFAWNEELAVLSAPLSVDFLVATGSAGSIPAGRKIQSHGLVFDPKNSEPELNVTGFVTFARPIIGVITLNAQLVASDFLGEPATEFDSTPSRGLEARDSFTVSPDGKRLDFSLIARNPGDNMRILSLVPEASTWAMLIAGFGLVGMAARRRTPRLAA